MNTHPNRIHAISDSGFALNTRGRLRPSWRVLRGHVVAALERWRSAEIEDIVQRNGGAMSDSLERDIAAPVGRSRGL